MPTGKASALRDELTPMLALVALLSSCGAWTFGWDNAWWSGIMGNTYFGEHYGELPAVAADGSTYMTLSATQQSVGTGLGTAGIMVGCMIAGQVAHWGGRKLCFYAVALVSLIGVLVQVTSGIGHGRFYQMAVGKLIVGTSIGIASIAVPLYQAECAPAAIRGALVNTYVTVQALGGWNAYACLYTLVDGVGQKVWIIPIMIQLLAPVLMIACGWFIPESPRWLVEKGRDADAKRSLERLRRGKRNYDADEDVKVLKDAHNESLTLHGDSSWIDCFRGSDLKRTLIVMGIQCLQQGQGIGFMSQYLIIFFLQLGFTNAYEILVIIGGLLFVLTCVGFFTQDYVGRRVLLMVGAAIQGGSLICVGAITMAYDTLSSGQRNGCLALIFIWLIAFTQSWTNIPWTVAAELPSSRLRDKTLTIGAWGGYGVGLIITFVNPYMQDAQYGNLGGGVGFIYGAISVASIVFVYFFLPELKGVTLETVDAMFDAGISPRLMGTHPMRYENHASVLNPSGDQVSSELKKHDSKHKSTSVEHFEGEKLAVPA
nr:membrane transporter [Naematelia aurantialba]